LNFICTFIRAIINCLGSGIAWAKLLLFGG
jgi:hypothetical protein